MSNLLSNFISIIKNSLLNNRLHIVFPYNKLILDIIKLLYNQGYLVGYKITNTNKHTYISCILKKVEGNYCIHDIKQISKPSQRVYYNINRLSKVNTLSKGDTTYIISTPYGVLSDKLCLSKRISGEILFKIN